MSWLACTPRRAARAYQVLLAAGQGALAQVEHELEGERIARPCAVGPLVTGDREGSAVVAAALPGTWWLSRIRDTLGRYRPV